jgi:nucleotide-binding universal stress UspA family protein
MPEFHNIIAAIDFSETSLEAARTAAHLARDARGRLHLLHVVPDVSENPWTVTAPGVDITELQRVLTSEANGKLAALAAMEPFRSAHVTCVVGTGSVPEAVVRYATDHAADLIVLGTHGYGALKRLLLGHVADRVIREAHCPVLAFPCERLRQHEAESTADAVLTAP